MSLLAGIVTQFDGELSNAQPQHGFLHTAGTGWCCVSVVSSCFCTAQETAGQEPDGPLLRPLPPLPHADLGAVFTLLITGEGLADRRAITDSPQAWGLGTPQTPAAVSRMRRQRPTLTGKLSLAKLTGPKRDIKDVRGVGSAGTNGGCMLEKSEWGTLGASPKCHSKQSGPWKGHKN